MRLRYHDGLDPDAVPGFGKFRAAIEADDFARAEVKKIGDNLYRARLGRSARLLFSLYRAAGVTECLVLEHLPNHDYAKSRFLARGALVDESRSEPLASAAQAEPEPLVYLNPATTSFHVLDKVLSFDDAQQAIFELEPPLVIVGSAGSGKTALTLQKMKQAVGDVLYVSLSPYLVENARSLYHGKGYRNEDQERLDFLSFTELLESVRVPAGREATWRDFSAWFERHKAGSGLRDGHALWEEFGGVITGAVGERAYLSREEYLALGVRQSIFAEDERDAVHAMFERWRAWMAEHGLYDTNLLAHEYRASIEPRYDFVVVDEVQDFTNVQLALALASLRSAGDFLLCGDANQIVHPNFFSWSKLKSLFFEHRGLLGHDHRDAAALHVLYSNYRNSPLVTAVANRILKLKVARFGSVDRESNHLVTSRGADEGTLQVLADDDAVRRELDEKTARSTRFAVIVMHAEDKAAASAAFRTPLVFSIQEAKGLEYENIVLFGFIGGEERAFREIAAGVDPAELDGDELDYARARDKGDKSLEIYKFWINALYVAITRAVKSLYLVEPRTDHPLLRLLDLERFVGTLNVEKSESSLEDWQREARKLELQGKREQAEAIHERILERKPVPWKPLDRDSFETLREHAFEGGHKKELLLSFEFALLHRHERALGALRDADFKPARQPEDKALKQLFRNRFMGYELSSPNAVLRETELYGIDHRTILGFTPLMLAARAGNATLVAALIERGADPTLVASHGLNAAQLWLEMATGDAKFAQRSAAIWPLVASGSLSVQVDGRLEKIDGDYMGLFLLNVMFARFYRSLGTLAASGEAYTAAQLVEWLEALPDPVLPERRKKRAYVSGVLSGNELTREAPYNRKLFRRLRRGHYTIEPTLKLRTGERWIGVHELLRPEDLGAHRTGLPPSLSGRLDTRSLATRADLDRRVAAQREHRVARFAEQLEKLSRE